MFPTPCWSFFLPETGRFPCFPRLWYTPCAFPGMQLLLAKYAPIHISQTAAGDVRRYYFSHLTRIRLVIMMTVMMMMKATCCSKDKGWATVRSRRGVIRTRGGKLRQWVGASQSQYQFQLPPALTLGTWEIFSSSKSDSVWFGLVWFSLWFMSSLGTLSLKTVQRALFLHLARSASLWTVLSQRKIQSKAAPLTPVQPEWTVQYLVYSILGFLPRGQWNLSATGTVEFSATGTVEFTATGTV